MIRTNGLAAEFDRQLENFDRLGYAKAAGITADELARRISPLRGVAMSLPATGDGRIPFVIVLREGGLPAGRAITLAKLGHRQGFTSMEEDDIERFQPIEGLELPDAPAYLVTDVDTGRATLNVTPDDALEMIAREGRSPLTLDEGVALAVRDPEVLRTHNSFSMLGSRCGDRRVTAIWVSERRPRLGWCWAGNPHAWLGSASCARRTA